MPYAQREKRLESMSVWYARNRERQIAAVTARRKNVHAPASPPVPVLYLAGWEDRQRYAIKIAKRWYPHLLRRYHDDVIQIAAMVAITSPTCDINLSRAIQRECWKLQREIAS